MKTTDNNFRPTLSKAALVRKSYAENFNKNHVDIHARVLEYSGVIEFFGPTFDFYLEYGHGFLREMSFEGRGKCFDSHPVNGYDELTKMVERLYGGYHEQKD